MNWNSRTSSKRTPWAFSRQMVSVNEVFGRGLHRRMFGDVRRWAGTHRTSDKNLGVECAQIHPRLFEAFDQIAHKTFPPDEIAIRFHHALV